MNKQLKLRSGGSIELPFTQEWYDNFLQENSHAHFQDIINSVATTVDENELEDAKILIATGMAALAESQKHGTATISRVKSGKSKGQYKAVLDADNGEPIDPQNERYINLVDLKDTLLKYYPGFTVIEPPAKKKRNVPEAK